MSRNVFTIIDRSEERSTHDVAGATLTAANYDAQEALLVTLKSALDAIIIGNVEQRVSSQGTFYAVGVPSDPYAQRELKLLVRYQNDSTAKIYRVEVACPKLASLTYEGTSDFILLADAGIMAAYVTAFEAFARAPDDVTQTVTVLSAQVIGRNL